MILKSIAGIINLQINSGDISQIPLIALNMYFVDKRNNKLHDSVSLKIYDTRKVK